MSLLTSSVSSSCYSVAVSGPGGVARQYRVQYQTPEDGDWHMYASFRSRDLAEDCERQLNKRGYKSRVVAYALCPTAV
jgi:hypothetical protein